MHGYGASRITTLRKVQFPGALPALFASARIAAPLALIGALLAEWLATGQGVGYLMLTSSNQGDYDMMWASVVLVVVAVGGPLQRDQRPRDPGAGPLRPRPEPPGHLTCATC